MWLKTGLAAVGALVTAICVSIGTALADQPTPWQLGQQAPATPTMERITDFHHMLLLIIILIALFVLALLLIVMVRFRESRNPNPSRTSHNTVLEVFWTVVPIMILVFIAVPSFKLLYFSDRTADADMTIKATGVQFSWTYQYMDQDGLTFDSSIACQTVPKDGEDECANVGKDLWYKHGERALRLLDVDNPLVVPVDTTVRMLVTSDPDGVIHSWAVPAFGIKLDAVPGRVNETWFKVNAEGVYYGQCSELCGPGHGFMPITVVVLSKAGYAEWLERAKEEFAGKRPEAPAVRLAQAPAGAAR